MNGIAAVFLDRDGTIIEDRGHLRSVDDVVFLPDTVWSLQQLIGKFKLFIVTHQPGVSRGILSMKDVDKVNSHIINKLQANGISIEETYVCPHDRSEQCSCIKPLPYFLLKAADNYNLDLDRSYVIGDHPHDVELARNAGSTGIYVLTGHGSNHRGLLKGDLIIVRDIKEAAQFIIES